MRRLPSRDSLFALAICTAMSGLFFPACASQHFGPKHKELEAEMGCITFPDPRDVYCVLGSTMIMHAPVKTLCQRHDPERWVLMHESEKVMTLVGVTCSMAIDQDL